MSYCLLFYKCAQTGLFGWKGRNHLKSFLYFSEAALLGSSEHQNTYLSMYVQFSSVKTDAI